MIFKYTDKENVFETDKASGFKIAETESKEIVELTIKPEGIVPEHALPINVTFHVKSGSGKAKVDGRVISAHQGDVLEVKPDLNREWVNISCEDLVLLVIKDK